MERYILLFDVGQLGRRGATRTKRSPRARLRGPGRRNRRDHSPEIITLGDTPVRPSCIDLTTEHHGDVIDLTSPTSEPPVMILSPDSDPLQTRGSRISYEALSSDSEEEPRSSLSFNQNGSTGEASGSTLEKSISESSLSCPICFDSLSDVRRRGGRIMSTTCGHIFCQACIDEAIRSTHRCPTCRKKLRSSLVHPIFL